MVLNRRDILKGLAALGISLHGGRGALAAATEENGLPVVVSNTELTAWEFHISSFCTDRERFSWGHWSVVEAEDGSLHWEVYQHQFARDARRNRANRIRGIARDDAADLLRFMMENRVNAVPFVVRGVMRLEPSASASESRPPLPLEFFEDTGCYWEIIDDRAEVAQTYPPFNAIISPKTIYRGGQSDNSRRSEQYLAIIEPINQEALDVYRGGRS